MNATIIFALILSFFLLIAVFSSYNHIIRANISLMIATVLTVTLYVLDQKVFDYTLRYFLYDFSNSTKNFIIFNLFDNEIASLGVLFTFIFVGIYIISRIFLHYTMVGRNPKVKASRGIKVFYGINIIYYLLICFVLSSFLAVFFAAFLDLDYGPLKPFLEFVLDKVTL